MTHLRVLAMVMVLGLSIAVARAQLLITAKQFTLMFGQPKHLTIHADGQPAMNVSFDRQGRVTNFSQGDMAMSLHWEPNDDSGFQVVCTATAPNGESMNDSFVVSELTSQVCRYSVAGMDYDYRFKDNGAIRLGKISGPQGRMEMMPKYHTVDDAFPYLIYMSDGAQGVNISFEANETDAQGNETSTTQTVNGQSQKTRRTIEYY